MGKGSRKTSLRNKVKKNLLLVSKKLDDFKKTHYFCPQSREELLKAVNLWCKNKKDALEIYGHISYWYTNLITDMSELFKNKYEFNDDISGWETSNVIYMIDMFYNSQSFNQSLNSWDVSNVILMTGMFYGARSFNRPLEWDTQNVKCMNLLFCEAKSFNQPLRWNIESVKEMSYMFFKAENFNQSLDFLNIQKLNLITSSKTGKRFKKCSLETFLKDMFEECPIEEHHYQSFKKKLSSYQYK